MRGEYKKANDKLSRMNTVSSCLEKARKDGYTLDFDVSEGQLHNSAIIKSYFPNQVSVNNFYRFEGDSDPGDECIMYLVETDDHKKGVLFDGYGVYGTSNINFFMLQVNNIQKRV